MATLEEIGAFQEACKLGKLEEVQLLAERFAAEDVRERNKYAFCWSCINGHLEVAQWRFYRRRR